MLAWCGAALSCLLSVPQAIRVLRAERLDGISASTYVIVLGNAAVWAAWSVCTGQYAAGIPALINGPAAILILHRLAIEHRKSRTLDAVAAVGAPDSPLVAGDADDRIRTSMPAPILIEVGLAQSRSFPGSIPTSAGLAQDGCSVRREDISGPCGSRHSSPGGCSRAFYDISTDMRLTMHMASPSLGRAAAHRSTSAGGRICSPYERLPV
jgi:uncharacterized protein with PQ loop repeat